MRASCSMVWARFRQVTWAMYWVTDSASQTTTNALTNYINSL